ncbi:MAG: hypothetical protein HUK12_01575 [Muribaculaceae bacterium]|nr:hypothetical protein [Muribaculaceae bacterium]
MPRLNFVEKNEDSAKDLDKLGRLPDGEYEEWFGGWDAFPGLDSLKRAQTRNGNCVYARYDGVPEEVTITDGATIGFGGSEDPRNPNWHTHKEMVCSDKSGIYVGDAVSFTVRHNGKSVRLKGKVIEKKYAGKWDNGGGESSSWGRPTCSFTIRLTPKTIENAIAKLEGTSEAKQHEAISHYGMTNPEGYALLADMLMKQGWTIDFENSVEELLIAQKGDAIYTIQYDDSDESDYSPDKPWNLYDGTDGEHIDGFKTKEELVACITNKLPGNAQDRVSA